MIRVVLDTNILISGLFWKGLPRRIVDLAIANKIKVFTSAEILEEVESVLTELSENITIQRVQNVLRDILSYAQLTPTKPISVSELRDSKDTRVIACAVSAKVDFIVTGDKDLLVLKEYQGIRIVKARDFFELLG